MKEYYIREKDDGSLEFYTNDYELREQISELITMIADALSYRRMINRVTTVDVDEEVM